MDSKQLYEKQSNQYNSFFPIVRLEDIIDKITDKYIQWILNNYNHIYVEYSESREVTRNKVPQMLRRSGLWISYNNGKKNITEYYIGENTDVNNYVEWTLDDNWKEFDELTIQDKSITYQHLSDALRQLLAGGNTITNFPDEEDITSSSSVLSFKDRDYEPNNFSGLGRVILRKNIVVDKDYNVKNILTKGMIDKENTIYEIRYDFDLNGKEITIPDGCVLDFQGGSLDNGTIVGNITQVNAEHVRIFSNIIILGTWNISNIYSEWFDFKKGEIDNIHNFRNMMKMANSPNLSHIYIQEGEWYTSCYTVNNSGEYSSTVGIKIPSNVYIHNNAIIKQLPNSYEKTSIFYMSDVKNIIIEGGELIGDVKTHTGTSGEWGHGIYPVGVKNLVIKNIKISEFWGDGIDIQSLYSDYENKTSVGHCKNILIDNVKCLNNRRQGLSIEAVDGLIVRNSEFSGTGSIKHTSPGAGIDIEPWHEYQVLKNIVIENCELYNNSSSGLLVHLPSKFNQEHNIKIINCISDKGIWSKNVNGLFVNNFTVKNGSKTGGYLCLWEKGENIKIINSYFNNEIYFNGTLRNVLIDKCSFDMQSYAWSGFGIVFDFGDTKSYENINISNCDIKTNNKLRIIYISGNAKNVNFYNNKIEGNSTYALRLGNGEFIQNYVNLPKTYLTCTNYTDSTVKIDSNTFILGNYVDRIINFSDTESVVDENTSFDYIFTNNKFITIGGYWLPFNNNTIIKTKFINNEFSSDIKTFLPESWSYTEYRKSVDTHRRSITNIARTNALSNQCYCIKVPYKRSRLKLSLVQYYIVYKELFNSDTIIDINPDTNRVFINTYFDKFVLIDDTITSCYPVFSYEIIDSYLYIYITDNTEKAKRWIISADILATSSLSSRAIVISTVNTPDLNFSITIKSQCAASSINNIKSYINKYNNFKVGLGNKILIYLNGKWFVNTLVEYEKESGIFNNKPENVDIGFSYFCTDRRTTEGTANGITIYHKGNNVWVDALGRVVE